MKLPWKKNFIKLPHIIATRLKEVDGNTIKIICIKEIPKNDIVNGIYEHIGIKYLGEKVNYLEKIMPKESSGRYSKYNKFGREIIRKDLPKVPFSYDSDAPNYKGDGYHTVTHDIMMYQRDKWLPQEILLKITKLEERHDSVKFQFELDYLLRRDDENLNDKLLFCLNLLQENCGKCDIANSNLDYNDYIKTLYVDWQFLPPGEGNFNNNLLAILKKHKFTTPEIEFKAKDRLEFFESLKPVKYIHDTTFNQYFGALLKNDIVLLENLRYGNAIYIFYEDWEKLSRLSKVELLNSNSRKFERIKHTKNWRNFVKVAINI